MKYYSLKEILKTNADYNIIYGARSTGKSYSVIDYVLDKKRLERGEEFFLIKRFDLESKKIMAQQYFAEYPVEKKTGGVIDCYANQIRLCKGAEKKKVIGYYTSISGSAHWKSTGFPNVTTIILEEFFSKSYYLDDECNLFLNLVSTIARDRKVKVFLIGNTVSRFCPYIEAWNLYGIMKQKPGTIEVYTPDPNIKIAVEYTGTVKENKMFFGKDKKSIVENEWEAERYPRLPKPLEEYEILYTLLIRNTYMGFRVNLILNKNLQEMPIVYVYPSNNSNVRHIISTEFTLEEKVTPRWLDNKAERLIQKCIKDNKIVFSSDLCGTEFFKLLEEVM